jgi:hypothetical protein
MEALGIIRRSNAPRALPLHVVPKPNGGWRPCGDYCRLNDITVDDRYPLLHIQDFNSCLADSNIFSKIDLVRSYYQIPVAADSIPKTAIITLFGLWEFVCMPFGLKNAPPSIQEVDGWHPPWRPLRLCLLDFLGHRVTPQGIRPMPDRVLDITAYPIPSNRASLQRFLGMINYYHPFLPKIAGLLAPLHAASSGRGQEIEWTEKCQATFEAARSALATATLLHHPQPDSATSITTDASDIAVGAQLEQLQRGKWVPIAFFSKKLSDAEKKYSAFDQELLATYLAVKHFSHFVEGRKFTLYTDHKPLTFTMSSAADISPRQTRHLSFVAEFTTDLQHVPGKQNVVADALSRVTAVSGPQARRQQYPSILSSWLLPKLLMPTRWPTTEQPSPALSSVTSRLVPPHSFVTSQQAHPDRCCPRSGLAVLSTPSTTFLTPELARRRKQWPLRLSGTVSGAMSAVGVKSAITVRHPRSTDTFGPLSSHAICRMVASAAFTSTWSATSLRAKEWCTCSPLLTGLHGGRRRFRSQMPTL